MGRIHERAVHGESLPVKGVAGQGPNPSAAAMEDGHESSELSKYR
jgi:hypothetical protein